MATIKYTNETPSTVIVSAKAKIPEDIVKIAMKLGYVAARLCRTESRRKTFVADGFVTPTINYDSNNNTIYTTDVIQ